MERASHLDRSSYDVHFFNFFGMLGWLALLVGTTLPGIIAVERTAKVRRESWSILYLSTSVLFAYAIGCAMGFLHPYSQFRELEMMERGLRAHTGTNAFRVDCQTAPSRTITLPHDKTYFTFVDPGWRPDWDNLLLNPVLVDSSKKDGDFYSYIAAEMKYFGPIEGCRLDAPLYAICIGFRFPTREQCWMGLQQSGEETPVRRATATRYIESEELGRYHSKDNLVEFNTDTLEEAHEWVASRYEERDDTYRIAVYAWFSSSLVYLLLALYKSMRALFARTTCIVAYDSDDDDDDDGITSDSTEMHNAIPVGDSEDDEGEEDKVAEEVKEKEKGEGEGDNEEGEEGGEEAQSSH